MKRPGKALDVKTLEALKPGPKPYRVSDGGGLLLDVRPTGAKVWLCRLTVDGKRRDMGLGSYPRVTLADARRAAQEARRLVTVGNDPIIRREAATVARKAARQADETAKARTFAAMAEACIVAQAPGWKNARTDDLWRTSLKNYAFPVLGDMPVAEVDRAAVLRAIDGVWTSRPATGRKVLRRIGTVLRYAAAHGFRANDNPADARMLRHAGLSALPGGRNQPSLPWAKAPAFMKALDLMPGLAPLALRFCILTVVRSGEVRGARWSEISFEGGATWTIPGERMKGKKSAEVQPHRVPLTPAAVAVLVRAYSHVTGTPATAETLPKLAMLRSDALVFPSAKPLKPFSDMALSAVMRRMNEHPEGKLAPWRDADGRDAVPHGWRATFRTWVDDTCPENAEAAERALAHEVADRGNTGSYRRSDVFERRRPLMESWAGHCLGSAEKVATRKAGQRGRTL